MKLYAFGRNAASPMSAHDSVEAHLSRVARFDGRTRISTIHLGNGGSVGRHIAAVNQLFLVVAGSGWARGADGERVTVVPGQAVFWQSGDDLEMGTTSGLIAVVIESRDLDPSTTMTPA